MWPGATSSLSLLDLLVEFGRADNGDGLRQHHLVWAVGVQVNAGQEGGLSRVRLWSRSDLSHIWENCKPLTDIWGNNHFKIITCSCSSTIGSGRWTWYSNSLHNIACYWISMVDMNYISREGRNVRLRLTCIQPRVMRLCWSCTRNSSSSFSVSQ